MSGLIAPTASPKSTSTRASAARAVRAKPPARPSASAAPPASAPRKNLRLSSVLVTAVVSSPETSSTHSSSEAHVGEAADDLALLVLRPLLLRLAQALESVHGRLRGRRALQAGVGAPELVVGLR